MTCIEVMFPEICEQRQTKAYTERATSNGLTDSASLGKHSSNSDLSNCMCITSFLFIYNGQFAVIQNSDRLDMKYLRFVRYTPVNHFY